MYQHKMNMFFTGLFKITNVYDLLSKKYSFVAVAYTSRNIGGGGSNVCQRGSGVRYYISPYSF